MVTNKNTNNLFCCEQILVDDAGHVFDTPQGEVPSSTDV